MIELKCGRQYLVIQFEPFDYTNGKEHFCCVQCTMCISYSHILYYLRQPKKPIYALPELYYYSRTCDMLLQRFLELILPCPSRPVSEILLT